MVGFTRKRTYLWLEKSFFSSFEFRKDLNMALRAGSKNNGIQKSIPKIFFIALRRAAANFPITIFELNYHARKEAT